MTITDKNVNEYLDQIGKHLNNFKDKDQILRELKAHIWDAAQEISEKENVSVTESFKIALARMEDPKTLANSFKYEYEELTEKYNPEDRISGQQFLVIGVIGLVFVAFASAVFTIINQESWIFWVFTLIPGIVLAVSIVIYLYYNEEKEIQGQMEEFREEMRYRLFKGKEIRPSGFWKAFGTHIGGLIGVISILGAFLLVFWIDATGSLPLFNENWYTTGAIACYTAWGSSLIMYLAQLFLGQIRVSKLIQAGDHIIGSLCLVTLFIAYPFTIGEALSSLLGSNMPNFLVDIDFYLHIIFGIASSVMFISALYDFSKFGLWQPEDKKSLL